MALRANIQNSTLQDQIEFHAERFNYWKEFLAVKVAATRINNSYFDYSYFVVSLR